MKKTVCILTICALCCAMLYGCSAGTAQTRRRRVKRLLPRNRLWWYNGTTRNGYNVYVEQTTNSWTGEKCLKVYFLYGKTIAEDTII